MVLLTAKHIQKRFSEKQLLEDINLSIHLGDKIGLVGVNGSGKSTLLQIIAGAMEEDGGEILRSNELRIGYLPQNPDFEPEATVLEQAMEYVQGAVPEYVVKTLLTKLRMNMFDRKMKALSGGQRKRVAMAAVMCRDTNLLILDEPTNHMDNDIIEWLEEQLEQAKANERKRANLYRKELRWIRWTAPARTTKSRSRVQRFQEIEAAKETFDDPRMEIGTVSSRLGKKIIELKDIGKSYGNVEYIHDFSYNILRNDRIGIVGNNGCGKTTLLRIIMGQVTPDTGSVEIGETVRIGYFSQESEEMDPNLRVIKYVEEIARNVKTKDGYLSASQMLEKFLFPSYMHSVRIEKLSGGERRRLYLLAVLMRAPNVLILDEPTNDLDIDTLTVLEDYLDDFPGAVLIVSHDRYFLDRLVIRTFAFEEGGEIREYTGGYSKYMNEKEAREEALSEVKTNSAEDGAAVSRSSDGRNQRAPKLRFTYKEQKEFDTIDEDIETLEEKIGNLEREMMQNGTDSFLLADLSQQKTALEAELDEKMERWEYLHELAERIERGERTDGTVD